MAVITTIILVYLFVWMVFMINFVFNFQFWADDFEFEIRNQKMTTDQFCKWMGIKIALWPIHLKTLL